LTDGNEEEDECKPRLVSVCRRGYAPAMSDTTFPMRGEDPWRIFRIMAEFVDSFMTLSEVGPAVTISVRRGRNPATSIIAPP